MAEKKFEYVPESSRKYVNHCVSHINSGLARLQEYVTARGESWEDVLVYMKRGADWRIREREAECSAWLEKSGAPEYTRRTMIESAVADLGEDNLKYWHGLAPLLRVSVDNTYGSIAFDVCKNTDVSGDAWQVSQSWIDEQLAKYVVRLPEWMIKDFRTLIDVSKTLSQLSKSGYDLDVFYNSFRRADEPISEEDFIWFHQMYDSRFDSVHTPEN